MEEKEKNMDNYQAFRKAYPEFIYEGFKVWETEEELAVTYRFRIPGLAEFAPSWRFGKPSWKTSGKRGKEAAPGIPCREETACRDKLLEKMVFSLGMVELVSYWKLTCSPRVTVRAGALSKEQIAWWKDLYFNGLGEFFYVNRIEAAPENFMELTSLFPGEREGERDGGEKNEGEKNEGDESGRADGEDSLAAAVPWREINGDRAGVLVPIGGGKDSAVTLELFKEAGVNCFGYVINPRGATICTAEAAGLPKEQLVQVKRTLDKRMLELNRQGFLNGHTPFSAIVAFSSLISAYLYGLPYIALSNESSANESTVFGSTVNHQYSKSFRFERDFHEYAKMYLPGSSYYFSMLRPLSEFQIARYFAGRRQYHGIFKSCNVGSKEDRWCGHCPKCLFVYLILSPFLKGEELEAIFGKNLLEDESLYGTLKQLTGLLEEKPFECVGSRSEVNTAITLTIQRMEEEGKKLPKLLKQYRETGLYEQYLQEGDRYSHYFDRENLVPEEWEELVRRCAGV